jgi:hypothetical protein
MFDTSNLDQIQNRSIADEQMTFTEMIQLLHVAEIQSVDQRTFKRLKVSLERNAVCRPKLFEFVDHPSSCSELTIKKKETLDKATALCSLYTYASSEQNDFGKRIQRVKLDVTNYQVDRLFGVTDR